MDDILQLIWIKVFFLFSGMCENQLSRHKCHNNDFKLKYCVEILIRNKTKFCIQISTYVNTAIVIRNTYLVYTINKCSVFRAKIEIIVEKSNMQLSYI